MNKAVQDVSVRLLFFLLFLVEFQLDTFVFVIAYLTVQLKLNKAVVSCLLCHYCLDILNWFSRGVGN